MTTRKSIHTNTALTLAMLLITVGCRGEEPRNSETAAAGRPNTDQPSSVGPESSAVNPTLDKGWCAGHGVPESVCTRCNSSLIPRFKEAGDWCNEHGLPESQCTACHPEIESEWEKLNPDARTSDRRGDASEEPAPAADEGGAGLGRNWCAEHGVPESVCTRCDPTLIARFKNANDWCTEHGLPESQCTICNPKVREEFAALRPASDAAIDGDAQGVHVERAPRLFTGKSDPLCVVDTLRVRFIDPSIVRKAGIEVERVQRRAMSATLEVPAEVEFDATRVTRITPRVAGIVRGVPVSIGDFVDAHDLLAVLDSPALGEAKSRFIERAQDLRLAEADLERVTTIGRGIQRMLDVCNTEASATEIREALATSPVGDAKAGMLRAHAALQLARSEAQRQATLLEKRVNSERDHQSAQSALVGAEAEFVALREELAFNSERDRLAAARAVEVAKAARGAAERRLHILGLTDAQVADIGRETDELLTRFEIRSPTAGRLIERGVGVGESVAANDVLFVVADTSNMWLRADVYERDLLQLRVGLPVHATVDGMPGAGFEGRVTWISSQVDDRTRTIRLRADLPNPDGVLRAKMFARARIVLHDNGQVVSVPIEAVQTDGCCQLAFVCESETVFQPRKVMLGASANGFVEVLGGLTEGEVVASTGSFLLKTEILKSNIGAGCCEVDPGR
ncbi:MAG: efflux RND transporter periplasmic adaptor subunit [Phycisphaerales bacterium]|nr:MAG: efflux RND transporter periplasmic adaptor subunit [Phycisphaerales bacterium]